MGGKSDGIVRGLTKVLTMALRALPAINSLETLCGRPPMSVTACTPRVACVMAELTRK